MTETSPPPYLNFVHHSLQWLLIGQTEPRQRIHANQLAMRFQRGVQVVRVQLGEMRANLIDGVVRERDAAI